MRIMFVLLALITAACATAADTLLVESMEIPALYSPAQPELGHKWTGTVSLDTKDFREGKGSLRFDTQSAKSGGESYPQWGRSFDSNTNDWTGYKALRYWVKVQSNDPNVGFKNMCVVVYNGDAPLQQFTTHQVPVGRWVQLTDMIMDYDRGRVRGIVIYMYETNPAWQDNYSWWIDGMELVPMEEDALAFDAMAVMPQRRALGSQRLAVNAAAGAPKLTFDENGRVARFGTSRRGLYEPTKPVSELSGLAIRDWRKGEILEPVGGKLTSTKAGVTQEARACEGLKVWGRYQGDGDWLKCTVTVTDTKPEDRPLTVYFILPVDAEGWQWWDNVATSRPITGVKEYHTNDTHTRQPRVSAYPLCTISGDTAAVALATPLDLPRLQRTVYNPALGALYIAYDVCLTPAATKQKQTASFTFYIANPQPEWGFRQFVADYYRRFPQQFVKRVPKEGGWGCWGTYAANPKIAETGFMYHWGPDTRGGAKDSADPVKFDNEHGYLSFPYIELTNLHVSMEGYETAGNKEIMERINLLADPNRKEPLPPISYAFPYDDRLGPDRDVWLQRVFQAYLKSLIYDESGALYGRADKAEFSILCAKYIPYNPDPDIPGGAGEFFLKTWLPLIEKYYAERGARPDGFGWDNFYVGGGALDYRREHFPYADAPLVFDPRSLKPAIMKDMGTYEMQKQLAAKLRREGRYLIANQGTASPVAATMPLLDIFGYEWGLGSAAVYARTMGHHKPVCSLPVQPAHYEEPFVRDHLLYGCWPGGYYDTSGESYLALLRKFVPIVRRQAAAGWEPITYARADAAAVQVERFGGEGGRELLLSVRNAGAEDRVVTIALQQPLAVSGELRELVSGERVEVEGMVLHVKAPAGKVCVIGK